MTQRIVGLDIGGANLKGAAWTSPSDIRAAAENFPMWKRSSELAAATGRILENLGGADQLAITMTGELADCFDNRRQGVHYILEQLAQVVPADRLGVYAVDGHWLSLEEAGDDPWRVAASNWHALACWLGKWPVTAALCQFALVIDIGSTTVDIVPMVDGKVATHARTDRDRLELGQLVYTGMRRTPVCAIVQQLELSGRVIPVMAELFATVDDAYLLLGLTASDSQDLDTADRKPRTAQFAASRLARMIGEDAERLDAEQIADLAQQVVTAQALQVAQSIDRNVISMRNDLAGDDFEGKAHEPCLVCSGHGLPLLAEMVRTKRVQLSQNVLEHYVSSEVARCAPAAAVAWLLQQHLP